MTELIEPFLKSLSQQTYNNEDTSPLVNCNFK
jgi:hypothetical protein